MMSFTKDGQIDPALLKERDERLGKSTEAVKEARKQLQPKHPVAAAADHWEVRFYGPCAHFYSGAIVHQLTEQCHLSAGFNIICRFSQPCAGQS